MYDALTSTRSYREAYDSVTAVAIMESESGRCFDPTLLHIFIERTLPSMPGRTERVSAALRAITPDREIELLTA